MGVLKMPTLFHYLFNIPKNSFEKMRIFFQWLYAIAILLVVLSGKSSLF